MTTAAAPAETAMPEKTSLAGLTRAELADALRALDLPEREIRMRVAQLWHWIYFRGARRLRLHAQCLQGACASGWTRPSRSLCRKSSRSRSRVDGTRKWLLRLAPVDAHDKGAEIECVYIPESDRGTLVRLLAGRLHAQLQLLPHRHAEARAQPDDARDCRPD